VSRLFFVVANSLMARLEGDCIWDTDRGGAVAYGLSALLRIVRCGSCLLTRNLRKDLELLLSSYLAESLIDMDWFAVIVCLSALGDERDMVAD